MIDQGIVMLVSQNAGVRALIAAGAVGGQSDELNKDSPLPSWTYRIISEVPEYELAGKEFPFRRLEIKSYGNSAGDAVDLAKAIDRVLQAYRGVLPDPDSVNVCSCFRSDYASGFDDTRRAWFRMLEYEIWYNASA